MTHPLVCAVRKLIAATGRRNVLTPSLKVVGETRRLPVGSLALTRYRSPDTYVVWLRRKRSWACLYAVPAHRLESVCLGMLVHPAWFQRKLGGGCKQLSLQKIQEIEQRVR